MDPISQGVLGAVWAQCAAKQTPIRRATWLGVLGGVLADADTLIRSSTDTLLFLDYHRHFTHSLFFIPIGGLIAAGLAALLSRRRIPWREAYLPCTLGYASHGLLDACTSYGTSLLWPFSDARIAWNIISIIDPLFTLPLLAAVIFAHRKQRRRPAMVALAFSFLYLGLGAVQQGRATAEQAQLAKARGHSIERGSTKPSIGNNFVFRSFYRSGDRYYVDALRLGWLGPNAVISGPSVKTFDRPAFEKKHALSPIKRRDLDRFSHFSDGYLTVHPRHAGVVGDLRYATVPNRVLPLWGIDVIATLPEEHAVFRNFNRDIEKADYQAFWQMLLGPR